MEVGIVKVFVIRAPKLAVSRCMLLAHVMQEICPEGNAGYGRLVLPDIDRIQRAALDHEDLIAVIAERERADATPGCQPPRSSPVVCRLPQVSISDEVNVTVRGVELHLAAGRLADDLPHPVGDP